MRVRWLVLLALVACAARARGPEAPRVLDETSAIELRRMFDDARDRPRYIVAFSPT
jgi:hypothetical protein